MVKTVEQSALRRAADYDNRSLKRGADAVERAALETLPIIDVTPFVTGGTEAERRRVARQIREVCIDIGFFYITGHGIPQTELDRVLEFGHRFFELPEEQKMSLAIDRGGSNNGYVRFGGVDPASYGEAQPDLKERFIMARELFPGEAERGSFRAGRSRWPDDTLLPGFGDFLKGHIARRVALAQKVVRAFALSLDLAEDYFDDVYRHLGAVMLYNYYPPIDPEGIEQTQWSFSPHTDYGMFTLLQQDSLGGLQARNVAGDWIDVEPVPGAFVVNIGDLFAMWTNDLYKSSLHRVMHYGDGAARLSVPLFTYPNGTTMVRCLETCQGPDNPPRYDPIETEAYNDMMVGQSHRSGRPAVNDHTADRLQAR